MRFPLVPLALLLSSVFTSTEAFVTRRSPLSDCLNAASVPLLLTSSPGWNDAIKPYNLRITPVPQIVAIPITVKHVQSAVKCASNTNSKVSVKGGGHSYGAYGLSGTLVLNMQEFQKVTLDSTTKVATVGAGVRLGNMATKIFQLGQRGLPHGTCPGVGIGGHATLGGFGLDSRLWGLATDVVQSFSVVKADGTTATASATQNPDLFWALRGAGPGFAVVTEFKLKTFAAPSVNINWSYNYQFSSAVNAATVFQIAQDWGQQNAPKELGYGILVFPGVSMTIRGVYYGSKTNFNTIIAPLLAKIKPYIGSQTPATSIKTLGWIDSLAELAGSTLVTPVTGYDLHDNFYAKSIATHEATPLSLTAIKALFNFIFTTTAPAGSSWMIISNLYGGPGSVINSVPPSTDPASTSSYAHRDSGYVAQFYAWAGQTAAFDPAIITYVKNMVGSLGAEAANLPAYAPYADPELSQAEAQTRYWAGGVARLKAIKQAVDPKGILYNPQGF